MADGLAVGRMLRQIGAGGFIGIMALIVGFGVVAYINPIIAGGIALIFIGATLLVHSIIKAVATQFGMGDMV